MGESNKGSIQVILNSAYADEEISGSHHLFYFTEPIQPLPHHIMSISLQTFQMPYSFYNINAYNNKLVLEVTNYGMYTLTLDEKNYTASTLSTEITTQFAAVEGTIGTVIVCTYNSYTLKFTLTSTLETIKLDSDSTIGTIMGINFSTDIDVSFALSITMSNVMNLGGIPNVYIKTPNLSFNNESSNVNIRNYLSAVPVSQNWGEYILFRPNVPLTIKIANKSIEYLEIQLVDDDNQEIEINGVEYTMHLVIEFHNIIKEDLTKAYVQLKNYDQETFLGIDSGDKIKREKSKVKQLKKTSKHKK